MVNRFEQTTIWQKTLAKQLQIDIYEKEREFLRSEFENFRERAGVLAAEISKTLPEFTVHDITHIDALWETAELVAKDDFELTPAEAFVLGGAFLIHDLGMGLASFPNGIEELKKESIWKDTVAALIKERQNHQVREEDFLKLDKDTERIATENVLRLLHAKHAENLAKISWKDKNGHEIFLIENTELRESYGSIIGLIAHSHCWTVEELEVRLPQKSLGAPSKLPSSWEIDSIKLACILRIADATQIDDRRAPSFLRTLRNPSNYSDIHWNFQQKLYQPRLERNRIVYTSKSSFSINEVDSWWTCYDTLQMIDNELKEVDSLLVDTNRQRLKANGVASVEDASRLSKLISVNGWQPVDTKIKVTNVAKLVGNLGGKQLYGDNSTVPLRELIQNASDAIRARRILEGENDLFGNIIVRFGKDDHGQYIEVEDNGIGMSSKVMIGPFLDFGQSFWGTTLMHEELPGLEAKGFISTGKYGIGFFSIFMWGKKVSVSSKRYENGRDSTLVLEFNDGVSSRPILRKADSHEVIKDGGTRIRVWLSNDRVLENLLQRNDLRRNKITYVELIQKLCPSIDCNIILEAKGTTRTIIKANDWVTITPLSLLKRMMGSSYYKELEKEEQQFIEKISKHMLIIKEEDGTIVGRAFLYKEEFNIRHKNNLQGLVTVGGFRTSRLTGLIGILVGRSARASRDVGIPIISHPKLKEWSSNQAVLLSKSALGEETEIECASIVRRCGGNSAGLKIAYHKSGAVNYEMVKELICKTNKVNYIVIQDAAVNIYERNKSCKIDFLDNVFWVAAGSPGILLTRSTNNFTVWPQIENQSKEWFHSVTLEGLTTEAFSEVWGNSVDEILGYSDISSGKKKYAEHVGYVDGKSIIFEHIDIIKKPQK